MDNHKKVEKCKECGGNIIPVVEHEIATILECQSCKTRIEVYHN